MARLTCGIDIGSTNIKVVLADDLGRSKWIKSVHTPRVHDGIGVATDAAALVAAIEDMIIEGWRAVGHGEPLLALAAGGIGEDGVGVRSDLTPTCPAIPWFDRRAENEVQGLAPYYPEFRFDSYSTACKWRWLAQNRPQDLATAKCWVALTDYPSVAWCGEAFISETLAARTGCFDVRARHWLPDVLAYCQAPALPRVLKAGQVAGYMQPGPLMESGAANDDTAVVAGGHDHPIATSAILRLAPNARIDSLGTANSVYAETAAPAAEARSFGLDICTPARGGAGIGLLGFVDFTATLFGAFGGEEAVRRLLAMPDLGGDTSEGQQFRALLDELNAKAKAHLDAFDALGVDHGPIYATGGWARSDALMQTRADAFGEPVTIVEEPELVALGAALLAIEGAQGQPASFTPEKGLHVIQPRR